MKRTPLVRRTPLRAHSSLRRTTPLAAVSARRAGENRARTVALRPLRETQVWCSRCGVSGGGLDAHEVRSRARGGSIVDVANIVLLCRPCHSWVTEHPTAAEASGWSV